MEYEHYECKTGLSRDKRIHFAGCQFDALDVN